MHSQIGMLRQTILDLRQGVETQRAAEAEELEIIRRKIDSLEGAALGSGHHEQESPPLENMDDIMAALVRGSAPFYRVRVCHIGCICTIEILGLYLRVLRVRIALTYIYFPVSWA